MFIPLPCNRLMQTFYVVDVRDVCLDKTTPGVDITGPFIVSQWAQDSDAYSARTATMAATILLMLDFLISTSFGW